MDEQDLRKRLVEAAHEDELGPAVISADIERGRRGLLRRRAALAGGTLATLAVLGSAALLVPMLGQGSGATPFIPAGGGPFRPIPTDDPNNAHHDAVPPAPGQPGQRDGTRTAASNRPRGPGMPGSTVVKGHGTLPDLGDSIPYSEWRNDLFALAGRHLDPSHGFLNYDTDSLQSGSGQAGIEQLGIKLGWSRPGDTGEGMVQLAIASPGGAASLYCAQFYGPCRLVDEPGYGQVRIGGDPSDGTGYVVMLTQGDGEVALVCVDPLFGNNSLTPTDASLPDVQHALELAADPDFDLPSS